MRVVVADDSVLLRQGVVAVLREAGFDVVAEAGEVTGLLAAVATHEPDVAVVDIRMPPGFAAEGIEAERRIRAEHHGTGVLLLSQYLEPHYALELVGDAPGGVGYLLKDRVGHPGELVDAVRRVGDGQFVVDPAIVSLLLERQRARNPLDALTDREREVLGLLAEGRSNAAIAARLYLSAKTVETHCNSIFMKLDLPPAPDDNRRVLAVLLYLRS